MDSQETPINRAERRQTRLSRAAKRISAWWVEWVIITGGDGLRALFELARRPFEWLAWVVRRGVLWPLQDRGGNLSAPGRVLAAVGAALIVGVGVAALLSASSGSSDSEPAAAEVAVVTEKPEPAPAPKPVEAEPGPTLEGAAPTFKPSKDEKQQAKAEGSTAPVTSTPADPNPATAKIGSKPGASVSSAPPSSPQSAIGIDGPPAGPEAIAVAEDFAGAFVLYETGGEKEQVRKAFKATATPELTKSLLKRPPRQPANVDVPKAKVVNVVAGPSHGSVYSVSVSLLRVGLTSELRLDMEKLKNDWRVTNVLG